jgi:hypothetical protein
MKPTTATTYQELKDFKESYKEDITEIKLTLRGIFEQTKKTNGRVTSLEVSQMECPAREAFKTGLIRKNLWNSAVLIVAIVSAMAAWAAVVLK